MTNADVIAFLEELAPTFYAEKFDNVGLQIGTPQDKVSNVLVSLDITDQVLQEAIDKDCSLIITFHPLIYEGLKNISTNDRVSRICRKAIQEGVSIYVIHTNLDNSFRGVNRKIAQELGLEDYRILIPKTESIYQLTTYVPSSHTENVLSSLFQAGAGQIGDYSHCSFSFPGEGTYKPQIGASPYVGKINEIYKGAEICVRVVFPANKMSEIEEALRQTHPYEEVAYEINKLENKTPYIGMGGVGNFPQAVSEKEFLSLLSKKFNPYIRHSKLLDKPVQKVAVLGGSGSFAISAAIAAKADAFVTADLKYHNFFLAEDRILLCDVGHYESEKYTKDLLVEYLVEKITTFAVLKSEAKTNPVNYYKW